MRAGVRITVQSISVPQVIEKVKRAGIPLFSARRTGKNRITFEVAQKDSKKVFAILRGTCYNVVGVERRGLSRLAKICLDHIGLLAGALFFCALVLFCQSRVLRIEVVGNGAYYEPKVLAVLAERGIGPFSAPPEDVAALSAEFLSFPRVNYCALKCEGGVLRVELRVSDEAEVKVPAPLLAPATGTIVEIVVLRGTPLYAAGDFVSKGEPVVADRAVYGEREQSVVVVARVKIAFEVRAVYEGEESAVQARAYAEFGEIEGMKLERTEEGWLLTGTAFAVAESNLT